MASDGPPYDWCRCHECFGKVPQKARYLAEDDCIFCYSKHDDNDLVRAEHCMRTRVLFEDSIA